MWVRGSDRWLSGWSKLHQQPLPANVLAEIIDT